MSVISQGTPFNKKISHNVHNFNSSKVAFMETPQERIPGRLPGMGSLNPISD